MGLLWNIDVVSFSYLQTYRYIGHMMLLQLVKSFKVKKMIDYRRREHYWLVRHYSSIITCWKHTVRKNYRIGGVFLIKMLNMSPQIFAGIKTKEKTWFTICNVASLPLKLTFHTACVQLKSKNFVAIISHQFLKHIEQYNTHPFIENDTNILGANHFEMALYMYLSNQQNIL